MPRIFRKYLLLNTSVLAADVQVSPAYTAVGHRLVTGTRRCDHVTPVLRQLHWLPVRQRVDFKVATFVHRSLSGISPTYLADDCRLVADARERRLRSTESRTCVVAPTYSSFGAEPLQLRAPYYGTVFHRT